MDPEPKLRATANKLNLKFPLVSDKDGKLMDLFGIRHEGAHPVDGSDIPRSASILLGADGTILWMHVASNYRVRPKPETVLSAIKLAVPQT